MTKGFAEKKVSEKYMHIKDDSQKEVLLTIFMDG